MTDINDLVAKKVAEKIDLDALAAEIAKGIEFYWSDIHRKIHSGGSQRWQEARCSLGNLLDSDAVRRQPEEALIEGLKNKK